MAQLKVSLGIGYPTATHSDVIDVDDDELAGCETEKDREELLYSYWQEWANNYIDGHWEIIE